VKPKPRHLGPEYAAQFQDAGVVAAYGHRPPYPPALFARLRALIRDQPRAVLEPGCGRGELARPLAPHVARLDAVDCSPAMIAAGRTQPGGDHPHLRWIVGYVEKAPLHPPYALITAGSSLHWMAWDVVLPRFAGLLTPGGRLALVSADAEPDPWDAALAPILARYSTNRAYQPYDLPAELAERGLFAPEGAQSTGTTAFAQPLLAYVEALHSMNGFSRARMAPDAADAFDAAVRDLVAPFAPSGWITRQVGARVIWGRPLG